MLSLTCSCGRTYDVPEQASGKKAKCRACGALLIVGDLTSNTAATASTPFNDQEVLAAISRRKSVDEAAATIAGAQCLSAPTGPKEPARTVAQYEPHEDLTPSSTQGHMQSLLWAFLFPTQLNNLVNFGCLWLLMCIQTALLVYVAIPIGIAGRIGMSFTIGVLVLRGLYYAFLLACITEASEGSEDLPSLAMQDLWEDALRPLGAWIGSWLLVLSPAILYVFSAMTNGKFDNLRLLSLLQDGFSAIVDSSTPESTVLCVLAFAGMAAWPMVVLCVALGGFDASFRVLKMSATVLKTFPAYFLTVVWVAVATLLNVLLQQVLLGRFIGNATVAPASLPAQTSWVLASQAVSLYFEITAVRAIGLYYHHYRHRFAWWD